MLLFDTICDAGWNIPKCPIFDIQNVVTFLAQSAADRSLDTGLAEIQDALPPYETFFMEWRIQGQPFGALWHCTPTPTGYKCEVTNFWTNDIEGILVVRSGVALAVTSDVDNSDLAVSEKRLMCDSMRFVKKRTAYWNPPVAILTSDSPKTAPPEILEFELTNSGDVRIETLRIHGPFDIPSVENAKNLYAWFCLPCLTACMFLSMTSSSVRVVDRQAPRPERRRNPRINGEPLSVFKVIETRFGVSGPRRKTNDPSMQYSEHICRGHKMRFGPKFGRGLLFGKYEGIYWCPPSIRGSASVGTVKKMYRVTVPDSCDVSVSQTCEQNS